MSSDPGWGAEPTRPIPPAAGWDEPTQQIPQDQQGDHQAYGPPPSYVPSRYPSPQPQMPYYPAAPSGGAPPYYPAPQPVERQSGLGWVSLGLSVVALVISVVAGVVTIDSWTRADLDSAAADEAVIASLLKVSIGGLIAQVVATLLGLAGLITGAVSLANRTSRLVGAFGLGLAIASPLVSWAILTSVLPLG